MEEIVDECLRLKQQLDNYVVKEFQAAVNKFCDDFDVSFWAGNGCHVFEHNSSKTNLHDEFNKLGSGPPFHIRLLCEDELREKHANSAIKISFKKYKAMFWAYANIVGAEGQVQSLDDTYGVLTWLEHYNPKEGGKING